MPQQAPRTVLTIDACGQALRVLTLSTINNDQPCLLREEIVKTACEAKAGSTRRGIIFSLEFLFLVRLTCGIVRLSFLVALWIDLTLGTIRKILLFQNFQKLTKLWSVKFESWLGA